MFMKTKIFFSVLILFLFSLPNLAQSGSRSKNKPGKPEKPAKVKGKGTGIPEFDIGFLEQLNIDFGSPVQKELKKKHLEPFGSNYETQLGKKALFSNEVKLRLGVDNQGMETWAFRNTIISASILEGLFDFRNRTTINYNRIWYFGSRMAVDYYLESGQLAELWIPVKGKETNKAIFVKYPLPVPVVRGVQKVAVQTGNKEIFLVPGLWYTIKVEMSQHENDSNVKNNGIFINFIIDENGRIKDVKGPFLIPGLKAGTVSTVIVTD